MNRQSSACKKKQKKNKIELYTSVKVYKVYKQTVYLQI